MTPARSLFLRLAILVAIIVLIGISVEWTDAFALLPQVQPIWLGLAFLCLTLQTLLSAERWRITAARLGLTIPRWEAVTEYYLGQLVNQALPGGVLGDANRAFRQRNQAGLVVAGQAVIFERAAGQIGLLVIFAASLPIFIAGQRALDGWLIVASPAVLVALILLAAVLVGRTPYMAQTESAFRHAVAAPEVIAKQIALSLATALCNIAAFACCAIAVGTWLGLSAALTLVPVILFAMLVPLSISGWGYREGAAAAVFSLIGATPEHGVAASIAFGLMLLLANVPGIILILTGQKAPIAKP